MQLQVQVVTVCSYKCVTAASPFAWAVWYAVICVA